MSQEHRTRTLLTVDDFNKAMEENKTSGRTLVLMFTNTS